MAYAALVADLNAKLSGFEKGMNQAAALAQTTAQKIEKAFSLPNLVKSGAAFFGAQLGLESIRGMINTVKNLSDEWTRATVLIENVTRSLEEAASAQSRLYEVAQKTRQNYGELSKTFASFSRNAAEIGITPDDAIDLQKTIAQAVALSGARADSAASALVQFGQGIAAGALRGEELNAVLEQTPKLAKAIADGMEVPLAQLLRMGKEGELTSERIISALRKVAVQMDSEFNRVTPTIADAFTMLTNAIGNAIDRVQDFIPVVSNLSSVIAGIAKGIDNVVKLSRLTEGGVAQSTFDTYKQSEDASRAEIARLEKDLATIKAEPVENTLDKLSIAARLAMTERLITAQRKILDTAIQEQAAAYDRGLRAGIDVSQGGKKFDANVESANAFFNADVDRRGVAAERAGQVNAQNRGISNAWIAARDTLIDARNRGAISLQQFEQDVIALMKRSGFLEPDKKPKTRSSKDTLDELKPYITEGERQVAAFERWRESITNMIDPTRALYEQLEQINKLESIGPENGLSAAQAEQARSEIQGKLAELNQKRQEYFEPLGPVIRELDEYLVKLSIENDLLRLNEVEREARVKLLDYEKKGLEANTALWDSYRTSIEAALKNKKLAEIDQKRFGPQDSRTADLQLVTEDLQNKLDEAAFFGGETDAFVKEYLARVEAILGVTAAAKEQAYQLGEAFQSAFEDAIIDGEELDDVLKALGEDIVKLILRAQITGPLAKAINNSPLGGLGGGQTTLFDGFFSILKGMFGFRAAGGPVDASAPYIVGEKGPELFVPRNSGTVVPNHALKSMGGVTVVNNIRVDSRSDRASIMQAMDVTMRATQQSLYDQRVRGRIT